ncbi:hypothetical protein F4Y19_03985 [Candidatus Poribacteria bacterium]|nr:hypothetical protein [Candidatus Poribacteria bacterium]MYH19497.1 hypothetical protein [Gemmatimonadota bacterium]
MGFRNALGSWLLSGLDFTDYTDMRLKHSEALAAIDSDLSITQAIENAIMLVSSTAARCKVTASGTLGDVWQPIVGQRRFLRVLARDLMKDGNFVAEITDPAGLARAADWEVYGKRSTRYRITHAYPDGDTVRSLPADGIAHVKINVDKKSPWVGNPPWGKSIAVQVERRLLEQASMLSKKWFSTPPDPDQQGDRPSYLMQLGEALRQPGHSAIECKGPRGADQKVQIADDFFMPDQFAVELRSNLISEIWESISYPPGLRSDAAPGQSTKDLRAQWVDGWLQSLMDSVAEQLSTALACDISIDTTPAKVPQVADQAKIVSEMVTAGVPLDEAKQIAGL